MFKKKETKNGNEITSNIKQQNVHDGEMANKQVINHNQHQ